MGRVTRAAAAVIACLLALGAARDEAPRALVVDVIALDANGRPIPALGRDDVTVSIDGRPRQVLAVRPVIRLRTLVPSAINGAAVAPADRLVVVIVDEATLARGNERAGGALASRLLERLAPSERIAFVRLPATASRLVLSANGPAVQQSARALIGRMPPPGIGGVSGDAPTSLNDDADSTDERGNVRPSGAPVRAPQSAADRASEVEALTSRVRQASASILPDVVSLLESLKALPGPKSVFFLSSGTAATPAELRALGAAAADARALVHVVQVPPAAWQREVFASQLVEAPPDDSQASPAPSSRSAGLAALAAAGGGLFAAADRKADQQVDRLLAKVSSGYVLELARDGGEQGGSTHAIAVSVAHPPGGVARFCPRWSGTTAAPEGTSAAASDARTKLDAAKDAPARPQPDAAKASVGRRSASMTKDPDLLRALERIGEVISGYVQDLSSVVAEERYQQTTFRGTREDKVRVLRSDFLLLQAPTGGGWTPFRDVFEVDGQPVRDREERLRKLFLEKPDTALQEALRIKEESVRYLLGDGNTKSNVNWPTFALEFLLPSNQWRFDMRRGADEEVDGTKTWRIDYTETAIPTLILTYDRLNVPARGSFWVDPATGRVLKTTLQTGGRSIEMTITVLYRYSESLGLLVPTEMREEFATRASVLLDGRATYGNFRRFQVSTAEQIRVPK